MGILDDVGKVADQEIEKMKQKQELDKVKREAAQQKEQQMKQQDQSTDLSKIN